ncbi:MAG: hypothetical protein J4415_00100 [Candidatus Diapherotrites archaeon]|uniref:Uncharacterized protein n=1 Tax=Candidatus Iainarchaeum sp. TaxID=3101447 RepID=A0A8T4KST6_9ARCH|nr:hypothetical protein [Candidatus Diapherotrites archaeon]
MPKGIINNYGLARTQIMSGKRVFLGIDKSRRKYFGEMVLNAETGKYVPAIIIAEKK